MEKKKLIYAAIVFIFSFALTYTLIKMYKNKKSNETETVEKIKDK
ncbi:hypothetical protein [Flavobacterium cutihirudinis]|nr:hypothetical protein [Flavobacterium cutihirudinis]